MSPRRLVRSEAADQPALCIEHLQTHVGGRREVEPNPGRVVERVRHVLVQREPHGRRHRQLCERGSTARARWSGSLRMRSYKPMLSLGEWRGKALLTLPTIEKAAGGRVTSTPTA